MMALLSVGCAENLETPDLPKLLQRSEKLQDFVPPFWNIEFIRQDDLNKDVQLGTVMVMKDRDDANFIQHKDCDSCARIDTSPRILIVLFADGKSWRLIKQNTTFIPRVTASMDSLGSFNGVVYGEVYAGNGTFAIRIGWFSTELGFNVYTFRWQDNDFYLIGYDVYSRHRMTGEEITSSYNFLTWCENIVTVTPVDDGKSDETTKKLVWKQLNKQPLLKLDQIIEANIFNYLRKVDNDELNR